ncbi:hypothetical protein SCA6_007146 [Theobroma cacao]
MQLLITQYNNPVSHVVSTGTKRETQTTVRGSSEACSWKDVEDRNGNVTSRITVLMISTPNRDDLVFPKGGWEDDETVHEAACREALEEAGVKGILDVGFSIPSWHRHDCLTSIMNTLAYYI